MEKFKCPWCGKLVSYSRKGNVEPHVQSPGVQCVGAGQPKQQVKQLKRLQREKRERADHIGR